MYVACGIYNIKIEETTVGRAGKGHSRQKGHKCKAVQAEGMGQPEEQGGTGAACTVSMQ